MEHIYLITGDSTEFIEITSDVARIVENSGVVNGICTVYIPHTTAGITINESNNLRVIDDMIKIFNGMVPSGEDKRDYIEGSSIAHIKASIVGSSENIIIKDGKLQMGDWQGIYFAEFNGPRDRRILVNVFHDK